MDYQADADKIDVRSEKWYPPYLQTLTTRINDLCAKKRFKENGGDIRFVGIEGDLQYGKATKFEWTAIQEDIDRGCTQGSVNFRPTYVRVKFENLQEELEWAGRGKNVRHLVVASCPARLGDNMKVFDEVENLCSEFDNIHICFARSNDLVQEVFSSRKEVHTQDLEDEKKKQANEAARKERIRKQARLTLDMSNRSQLLPGFDDSTTKVIIPDTVTDIGERAFRECEALQQVTIPDSVTSIGEYAFHTCKSLTEVTIPDTVTTIGKDAFNCCTALQKVTIPDSVTSIGEWAFAKCESLTEVTIPDSVTSIGYCAFYDCKSLAQVTIPDSVTTIGTNAFYCVSLRQVTIPDTVTTIGNSAFNSCTALQQVTIPDSVTSIGAGAFRACESLTEVTIPDSVTTIGTCAFWNCKALREATVPAALDISEVGRDGDGIFPEHTTVRRR